jgi:ribose transport system substrate-binding protein
MSGRGNILILEGTPASATSRERHNGFLEALEAHPGIKVQLSLRGDYLRDVARRAFLETADKLHGIDAVLSANDHMALGVLDALAERGNNNVLPLVVGVNAIPEAIAAIETGKMLATANFDPMAMTGIATEGAIRYLHGKAIPREIILPVQIVDRSNFTEWNRPFAERPMPRWEDVVDQIDEIMR